MARLVDVGSAATRERWEILFRLPPQFISDCNGERIIEIGPSLPKLT